MLESNVEYQLLSPLASKSAIVGGVDGLLQKYWLIFVVVGVGGFKYMSVSLIFNLLDSHPMVWLA